MCFYPYSSAVRVMFAFLAHVASSFQYPAHSRRYSAPPCIVNSQIQIDCRSCDQAHTLPIRRCTRCSTL